MQVFHKEHSALRGGPLTLCEWLTLGLPCLGWGSDDSKDVPGKWGDATASGEAFPLTSAPDPRSPSRDLPTAVSLCLSAQRLDSGSSVLVKGRINLAGYVGQRTFVFTPHSFFFF